MTALVDSGQRWLRGPERALFEELERHVPALRALATALVYYLDGVGNMVDAELLGGMASLIRTQGQATLRVADSLDVVATQIRDSVADEQLKRTQREREASRDPGRKKGGAR